jgi:hypothetical protein
MHPVVRFTVEMKWERFGRMLYIRQRAGFRCGSLLMFSLGYLAGSEDYFVSWSLFICRALCVLFVFIVPPLKQASAGQVHTKSTQEKVARYSGLAECLAKCKRGYHACTGRCFKALGKFSNYFRGREKAEVLSLLMFLCAFVVDPFVQTKIFGVSPDYYYYGIDVDKAKEVVNYHRQLAGGGGGTTAEGTASRVWRLGRPSGVFSRSRLVSRPSA